MVCHLYDSCLYNRNTLKINTGKALFVKAFFFFFSPFCFSFQNKNIYKQPKTQNTQNSFHYFFQTNTKNTIQKVLTNETNLISD
jgi:hypothetical protein